MPKPLRPEEEWARAMMATALDADVRQHDDGSSEAMHDLVIAYRDGTTGAAEVTSAADGESIALWNLMNGNHGRWIEPSLAGGWMVVLSPSARAKRIRAEIPGLLRRLEVEGVSAARRRGKSDLRDVLADLGVESLYQSGTDYPGSIYITVSPPPERMGGFVADDGNALARWIGPFLREERPDVLGKLNRSGEAERHAFVILPGFATVDFAVADVLMRREAVLPTDAPSLPDEVTHVWAVSTWSSGLGMRWSPDQGWEPFSKQLAEGD